MGSCWRNVLWAVGWRSSISPASSHQNPAVPASQNLPKPKCLQARPNVPWGTSSPCWEPMTQNKRGVLFSYWGNQRVYKYWHVIPQSIFMEQKYGKYCFLLQLWNQGSQEIRGQPVRLDFLHHLETQKMGPLCLTRLHYVSGLLL